MWLLLEGVTTSDGGPVAVALPEGEFLVGRSSSCHLVVRQAEVSRRHLRLVRSGTTVDYQDLSSRGTLVNGVVKERATLGDGDRLTVGGVTLQLSAEVPPPGGGAGDGAPASAGTSGSGADRGHFRAFLDRLQRSTDTRELLERLLPGLVDLLGAERGFVLLRQGPERTGPLVPVVTHRLSDGDDLVSVSSTVYGRAIEQAALVVIDDTSHVVIDSSAGDDGPPSLAYLEPRAVVCGPLGTSDGAPFGALYLDKSCRGGGFPTERLQVLETVVGMASQLLAAADTRQRLLLERDKLAAFKLLAGGQDEFVWGESELSRGLAEMVDAVGGQDVSVLVTGETGTGKEMVARALHRRSPRRDGPFVPVNCAALPRDIIEAELFGAERGAYTGATERRIGRFELAAAGTLFLDEIGELPLELQVKLLRVLQERTLNRLGSNEVIPLDFRLICATNTDLEGAVQGGTFRQDLFYRINVFRLELPPLRERPADIMPLAEHFLTTLAARFGRTVAGFTPEATAALTSYGWPGNIRELRNAVERAVVVERTNLVMPSSLPIAPRNAGLETTDGVDDRSGGSDELAGLPSGYEDARVAFARIFFERALARHDGNLTAVAREAGIPRTTVYRRLRKIGLMVDDV